MSGGTGPLGATRNRTDLFLKYRNQARGATRPLGYSGSPRHNAERGTHRLLEAALATTEDGTRTAELGGAAGVASLLPPRYVDFKEAIRTEMFVIKQKMNELRDLHERAALTTFDDSNAREMDIEVLTQEITRLFRKCEVRLQQFGSSSEPASEADKKVKGNVQRTLAIELQKLSVAFRKQQKAYLSKLSAAGALGGAAAGGNFAALYETSPSKGAFGGGGAEEDYDPGFSEQQTLRVDGMSALVDERDREVRNILQSINDLGQVMKDLSVLVIDQGTILDRIDYNMEQVATSVSEGVKQLVRAEKSQKQSRMILCIMFLACAVILLLLIVVLKKIFIG